MDKKKLLKLRKLNATSTMMRLAKEDIPQAAGYNGSTKRYKYGMYIRVQYLEGIVKAAVFFAEDLKRKDKEPRYEVFLNPSGMEFITYDRKEERWREAKIDNLDLPSYVFDSGKWMNRDGIGTVKSILEVENGGYRGIKEWQLRVRQLDLKKKHRRETEPWDMMQEQVPELPKGWEDWQNKGGCKYHYIFYTYTKKRADKGYCTFCQSEVPIKEPKHNKEGICQKCGKKIVFKSRGKAGPFYTDRYRNTIIQKCEDGAVIRTFICWKHFAQKKYEETKVTSYEARRTFIDKGHYTKSYKWEDYKNTGYRWVEATSSKNYYYYGDNTIGSSIVYQRTIPSLSKGILKQSGIREVLKDYKELDVEEFIVRERTNGAIEKTAKAGMTRLAFEISRDRYRTDGVIRLDENKKGLHNQIGITKEHMNIIKKNNLGAVATWFCRKYPRAREETILQINEWGTYPNDEIFTFTELSIDKMVRYLERQRIKNGHEPSETITFYKDYLNMANERGMILSDEIVCLQPDMMKYHDRYLEEKNEKANKDRYNDVNKRFKGIANDYLKNKYLFEYENDELKVLVPKCAADIVKEGMRQHHCVGASDTYMRKMNNRESFIVFIRRKEEVSRPYYTVEISHNNKVMQSYAAYDRQPDIQKIKQFEEKWIVEINKKMQEMETTVKAKRRA